MGMKKIVLLFVLVLTSLASVFSQGYEIKVKVEGVQDTVMYLGHYFSDKKYVIDTARVDSKGNCVFAGDEKLRNGIYIIVLPSMNMTYFEIIIGNEPQKFSIETSTDQFVNNMKVKNSTENTMFNDYQRKMIVLQEKHMALMEQKNHHANNEDSLKIINDQLVEVGKQRHEYILNMIEKNSKAFFSKVLKSMVEIEIPDPPKDENGNITDSTFQWRYFKKHYFDNIDFSEAGLLRTPIFQGKLNYFFDKVVVPVPDSMKYEADRVIAMAYAGDTLMFRFVAAHLVNYFESSKIMGFDEVFVHIAEQWYLSEKPTGPTVLFWLN